MKCRATQLLLALVTATLGGMPSLARADLVFQDNYESWAIDARPDQPGVTDQAHWSYVSTEQTTDGHTVQANPLVSAKNNSAQVLRSLRDVTPAERAFIDLTPAQADRLAAGELLTATFKHYQPEASRPSIAFAIYQNSDHDFTENSVDLEFLQNREVKHYKDSINGFQSTGLFGTDDWDDIAVVVNFITDTWTVSVNGVSSGDLTFRNDGDYTTARSLLFSPCCGRQTGFTDDLKVYIGATTVGVPGDYNNNGVVDAADYVLWRNGDSPDDTQAGYDLWKANFGDTSGSGASTGLATVPEPASAALALLSALMIFAKPRTARGRPGLVFRMD